MAHKETHSGQAEKPALPGIAMAEFAAMGQKRMEEFSHAQSDLFDQLQKANQKWLDRLQVEVKSASEFAAKLTAVRSIPDAVNACQEWGGQWFEMMTEDRKHLMDDYQKFAETVAGFLPTAWQSKGSSIGT